MINIENTKIVLLDFDDTLCIHENHQGDEDDSIYNKNILKIGIDTWSNCSPNIHLKRFMEECIKRNIKLGLISATMSYPHMKAKNDWVLDNYGIELENYCVGTYEGKVKIMIAISDAFNIPREQILIIDDLYENLERAAKNGFMACTPMEIVNYIETERIINNL